MRLALFTDLHANWPALEACHAHAQIKGYDQLAVLGDLIGYGPYPEEIVAWCQDQQRQGAVLLRGNHDRPVPVPDRPDPSPPSAQTTVARWTSQRLSAAAFDWMAALPLTAQVQDAYLVHATADDPQGWHYATDPQRAERSLAAACEDPAVRYVFGGHVHQQTLFYRGSSNSLMPFSPTPGVAIPVGRHRRWLATVGSLGQPRDGDPRACYALIDLDKASLSFHRVPYDHHMTAARIRALGLPESLAVRLERGE